MPSENIEYALAAPHISKNGNGTDPKPNYSTKAHHLSDLGNAKRLVDLHGDKIRYVKEWGWMIWDTRHWRLDNRGAIERLAADTIGSIYVEAGLCQDEKERVAIANHALRSESEARLTAMVTRAESEKVVRNGPEEFDCDLDVINCKNGVIKLQTGERISHIPDQKFTYFIDVPYNQEADYSAWVNFLNEVVGGGQEMIDYLQMAIGYTLTGHTREECLFYLFGPTRSGKGTFTETLFYLLGVPLAIEADFNTFTAKREQDASNFDLAPLKPARCVFASESNRYQRLNPAKIKQLTGGNWVRCCFKHKDFFAYRPQFKVWLSSNWEVNGDVDDDALWGRVRVIEFPNSFLGREDKELKARMREPANLEGILRWAVEGAVKWYELPNGLQPPEKVLEDTKKHRDLADYVQGWLDECTQRDETKWTPNSEVMGSYTKWCKENNTDPVSAKSLATTLRSKGYIPSVLNKYSNSMARGVQGMKVLLS